LPGEAELPPQREAEKRGAWLTLGGKISTSAHLLLKAYIHRVSDVNAEGRDAPKPASLVKRNRLWLPDACREPEGVVTQFCGLALQSGNQDPSNSPSSY
jgi:hypothetical protein